MLQNACEDYLIESFGEVLNVHHRYSIFHLNYLFPCEIDKRTQTKIKDVYRDYLIERFGEVLNVQHRYSIVHLNYLFSYRINKRI